MTNQLPLTIVKNGLLVGRHTVISFNRTLRVPEDGQKYNLPAGFGRLPILRVDEVADRVPDKWRQEGGLIIPLYQREALFLEFSGVTWRPTIAKVAVGGINAINGKKSDLQLKPGRQDYVVIPDQRWLDGVNSGDGHVKQFVAMPLGQGYTVEAQVTDEETQGGFQFVVYDPKNGFFSEPKVNGPSYRAQEGMLFAGTRASDSHPTQLQTAPKKRAFEMGIAAGGSIRQQIVEDEYGTSTWNPLSNSCFRIHIVNSEIYQELTGRPTPATPITAEAYQKAGIPWLKHYDETRRSVSAPKAFKKLLSVFQIDKTRGLLTGKGSQIKMQSSQVVPIRTENLHDRINSLRSQANTSKANGIFEAGILHARMCAELTERHMDELTASGGSSTEAFVAECYILAGECSALLYRHEEAEEFANRALNSTFSEPALALRLQSRIKTGKHQEASEDCTELLRRNPSHEYAIWAKSYLPS